MNKLKQARLEKELRQVDLARRANISLTWLWALENGLEKRVSTKAKRRLAGALGMRIEDLFPGKKSKK